jgi:hypothetical protein
VAVAVHVVPAVPVTVYFVISSAFELPYPSFEGAVHETFAVVDPVTYVATTFVGGVGVGDPLYIGVTLIGDVYGESPWALRAATRMAYVSPLVSGDKVQEVAVDMHPAAVA